MWRPAPGSTAGNKAVPASNKAVAGSNNVVPGSNKAVAGRNRLVSGSNKAVAGRNKLVLGSNKLAPGRNKAVGGSNEAVPGGDLFLPDTGRDGGRVTNLKDDGYIRPTGARRASRAGCACAVYELTDEGRKYLAHLRSTR